MAKMNSSACFAILIIAAAIITVPQRASSYLTGQSLYTCWEAISRFEQCVSKSPAPDALDIHLRLTPECCSAVRGIGEYCLSAVYPSFSFAPTLGSFLHGICGDYFDTAPQPTAFEN